MTKETIWMAGQIGLVADLEVGFMHRSLWTEDKYLFVSARGVAIRGGGVITSVAAHGCDVVSLITEVFHRMTAPKTIIYRSRDNRQFTWDAGLMSWREVPIEAAA